MKNFFSDFVSRENLENILVAYAFAMIIRCFFIDVYQIPTGSMEPTLMGDQRDEATGRITQSGDKIFANKFYHQLKPIERYEVVIFRYPLNVQKNFIKRIVGVGGEHGEKISFKGGNIFFKSHDSKEYKIARKSLETQESIWIPVNQQVYTEDNSTFDKHWKPTAHMGQSRYTQYEIKEKTLSTSSEEGVIFSLLQPILDSPLYSKDERSTKNRVKDLKLSFDLEIQDEKASFFVELMNGIANIRLNLSFVENWLSINSSNRFGNVKKPLSTKSLFPRKSVRVEFISYDGVCIVKLDGRIETQIDYLEKIEDASSDDQQFQLAFAIRNGRMKMSNLYLKRDIYYYGDRHTNDDSPVDIEPNTFFVIGDNVPNSYDSRKWTIHEFKLKDGRTIVCDEIELVQKLEERQEIARNLSIPVPDYIVKGDTKGNFFYFNNSDIEQKKTPKSSMLVKAENITGSAFVVWWPMLPFRIPILDSLLGYPPRAKLIK